MAYDPAFAYELAVIIQDGIRRMYENHEDIFYYLTVMNENYPQPPMPEGCREGILKGLYKFKAAPVQTPLKAQLLGSGAIMNEVIKAQALLAEKYGVAADIWSVTSYKELHRDALETERWNLLHPDAQPRAPYLSRTLGDAPGPIVAASDYVKALPDSICRWMPRRIVALGTDGFGRSDGRDALREFFEVDARYIALAVLSSLAADKKIQPEKVIQAMKEMGIDQDKPSPMIS